MYDIQKPCGVLFEFLAADTSFLKTFEHRLEIALATRHEETRSGARHFGGIRYAVLGARRYHRCSAYDPVSHEDAVKSVFFAGSLYQSLAF